MLKTALSVAHHVIVGITTREYLSRHPKRHPVETYELRAIKVLRYCLRNSKVGDIIEITPLDDPYGPTLTDPMLECIVVSEETFLTAIEINARRRKQGLKPLDIVVVEMILSPRSGKALSSSELWSLE